MFWMRSWPLRGGWGSGGYNVTEIGAKGPMKDFVCYRRTGDTVTPYRASLGYRRYVDGQPDVTSVYVQLHKPIAWSELYGGHVQWVADQVNETRRKIRDARATRLARKLPGAKVGVA